HGLTLASYAKDTPKRVWPTRRQAKNVINCPEISSMTTICGSLAVRVLAARPAAQTPKNASKGATTMSNSRNSRLVHAGESKTKLSGMNWQRLQTRARPPNEPQVPGALGR